MKKKKNETTLTIYLYNNIKYINYHYTSQIIHRNVWGKMYTIGTVLTSHSESCTTYLLIEGKGQVQYERCKNYK